MRCMKRTASALALLLASTVLPLTATSAAAAADAPPLPRFELTVVNKVDVNAARTTAYVNLRILCDPYWQGFAEGAGPQVSITVSVEQAGNNGGRRTLFSATPTCNGTQQALRVRVAHNPNRLFDPTLIDEVDANYFHTRHEGATTYSSSARVISQTARATAGTTGQQSTTLGMPRMDLRKAFRLRNADQFALFRGTVGCPASQGTGKVAISATQANPIGSARNSKVPVTCDGTQRPFTGSVQADPGTNGGKWSRDATINAYVTYGVSVTTPEKLQLVMASVDLVRVPYEAG